MYDIRERGLPAANPGGQISRNAQTGLGAGVDCICAERRYYRINLPVGTRRTGAAGN